MYRAEKERVTRERTSTHARLLAEAKAAFEKLIAEGQARVFRSITGGEFEGRVLAATRAGPYPAVVAEVAGEAFYTGEAVFTVEAEDPLGWGFLLRR